MVALRKSEIARFIVQPDPRRPIILLYGPDLGLVRERAEAIVRALAPASPDAFTLVPLEGDVLAADPGRLSDEARTIGLFGGRRIVRVRAGTKSFVESLKPLLADPPVATTVVIEAGDLRRDALLRGLCEASPAAAVIACYADDSADLFQLVQSTLDAAGIRIDADARETLVSLLGADRLATRGELEKLLLYAGGSGQIGLDDIREVIADASALALDDVIDAAAAGEVDGTLASLAKARAGGIAAGTLISAAIRQVASLHRLSLEVERGGAIGSAIERSRPPIHFRRRRSIERALARRGPVALVESLIALGSAALEARKHPALADAIAERALLALARR